LDSEFTPLTLKETSLNSFQSDFTFVRSRLTRGLSLLGGVFLWLSLPSVRLPLSFWFFGWTFFFCGVSWSFSCSFSFGASLITGRVDEIACFGRHCCSFGESRCPFLLLVLLSPFLESFYRLPIFDAPSVRLDILAFWLLNSFG
jgi:hypothetical protein